MAGARRLRHLLRLRHAHRELGALLQPAVLHAAAVRSRRRSRSRWRIRSRPDAASRRAPRSTRSIPNIRTAYSQQGTVGLDGVIKGTTIAVRYVTSHGDNLVRKRNINQAYPGPGSIDSRRPIPTLGDVLLVESTASSQLPRARAERGAAAAAEASVVPRRLHAGELDGRHVGVPRHRRRRQHAAGQPQSRGRVGPVGLRRAPAARADRRSGPHRATRAGASRATGRRARSSPRSRAVRSRRASASTTATPATSAAAPSPTIGPTSSPARRRPARSGQLRRTDLRDRAAVHVRQRRPRQPRRARPTRRSTRWSAGTCPLGARRSCSRCGSRSSTR